MYFQTQKVCPEEQWSEFMGSLKENLPTAFRITGSKAEANALLNIVKSEYFSQLLNVKIENEEKGVEEEIKPINLPWCVYTYIKSLFHNYKMCLGIKCLFNNAISQPQ